MACFCCTLAKGSQESLPLAEGAKKGGTKDKGKSGKKDSVAGASEPAGEKNSKAPKGKDMEAEALLKLHSAIRWQKTPDEIKACVKAAGVTLEQAWGGRDDRTGNQCLHIAAQNGHSDLVDFLVGAKADVNCQNNKGQTPLHMTVKYDFHFISKYFLDHGADPKRTNGEGHEALKGIDGDKVGVDAWDAPMNILRAVSDDKAEIDLAFTALEAASPADLDKVQFAQAGLKKKKECPANWNDERFRALMGKL